MCRTSKWRPIENWCACIRNSRIQPPAIKTRSRPWLWCSSPNSPRSKPLPAYLRLSRCSKPSQVAQALVEAGVEALVQVLRAQPAAHYGRRTAKKLAALANQSVSSGRARAGRSTSLRIVCDQLEHTQANLARLNAEIEQLLNTDPGVKGLQQVPEFGPKTLAVLRAELGDVQRFSRTDEVIAYGGMDIEIKESGHRIGKAKLSKRGSGLLRRMLYMTALRSIHREDSAFGVYYQRLVERGLKTGSALMAVMRKMLAGAAHLLRHEGDAYDRSLPCSHTQGFACRTLQD